MALTALAAAALTACGATCREIARDRQAFLARRAAPTTAPHAQLIIPFPLADRLLTRRAAAVPPASLDLTPLALLGLPVGVASVRLASVRLAPAPDGQIGFELTVSVASDARPLAQLAAVAHVAPSYDPVSGAFQVRLRPVDLRRLEPRLVGDGRDAVADWLLSMLPPAARLVVSRGQVGQLASDLLAFIASNAWDLLRDGALTDIGPLTELTFALPGLPVTGLRGRTLQPDAAAPALALDLTTPLPVATGLAAPPPPLRSLDLLQVRIAGDTLAELVNTRMVAGELPARFRGDGRPDPQGLYEAALAWASGAARPTRLVLWRTSGECLRATLAGAPRVALRGDALQVAVEDVRLEAIEGATLTTAWAWLRTLWTDALTLGGAIAASATFDLGDDRLVTRVVAAEVTSEALSLSLEVRSAPSNVTPPRPP